MSKITPKTVLKMASKKSKSNEKNELKDINLTEDNFSIEDLYLKDDESNIEAYTNLKALLDSVCTCQVSDAYNTVARRSGVINGLKSVNKHRVYGRIVTCDTNSDDWGTGLLAMDKAKEGEILFLHSNGEPSAIWGELASTCAQEKGIAGCVIYGYLRDIDITRYMDFPLFALDLVPNAGMALAYGKVNPELKIDGKIIKPGDFLFGDESGVLIIPQETFKQVMLETLNIKIKEAGILKLLKEGKSLSEIAGVKKE
ncbi:RraA family protein [Methanobrevibacter sp. 87.7]|uniref:RraA family protein n=1 Tax=Methanobrevibacter sp. 87.7 TaxID=387957 RepID=UPI001E431E0F|nr:RraA family protein [Methanobrevibacter sp. 87.7]